MSEADTADVIADGSDLTRAAGSVMVIQRLGCWKVGVIVEIVGPVRILSAFISAHVCLRGKGAHTKLAAKSRLS